jgi:transcription elongation factor S-II
MDLISTEKSEETIVELSKYIPKKYVKLVEQSIKNFANDYAETYDTPYLIENIYDDKKENIINALCAKPDLVKDEETAENIAFLKPQELYSDNYEKIEKKRQMEEYKKNDVKSSSAFKCSKCKESKCSVTQKQTRAGDEPATTFVTCLECGHSFSFN